MPNLQLDILILPTYDVNTIGIQDTSSYLTNPPVVTSPSIEIEIPGFNTKVLAFYPKEFNTFNSYELGITENGCVQPLPDGMYRFRYSVAPAYDYFIEKSIFRTENIQQKFDEAFLQLDLIECEGTLKAQASLDLNTINFLIQGAIAAANNCAEFTANKLYDQAFKMLSNFTKTNCGCN